MKTPDSILPHSEYYERGAWKKYDIIELGMWVHLLVKRSEHRSDISKAQKDLDDAQNYLNMIQSHIDEMRITVRYKNDNR